MFEGTVCREGEAWEGSGLPERTCRRPCLSESDCWQSEPLFAEGNFACVDGLCQNLGCDATQECEMAVPGRDIRCVRS
jgi:hypothetical protein